MKENKGGMCVLLFFACISIVQGGFASSAYRVLQYQYNGEEFGPQQSAVNLQAITYERATEALSSATPSSIILSRRAVLVPYTKATPTTLQRFKDVCGAIVILLPAQLSSSHLKNWTDFERWVVKQNFAIPVYYIWETKEWKDLYEDLNYNFGGGDLMEQLWPLSNSYQVEIDAESVKKSPSLRLPTLQGLLSGAKDNVRTFAIVAHYDTLSSAPALAKGVDENGSGLVALLELARVLSSFHLHAGSEGNYNVLFVITTGSRVNFEGTKNWLHNLDSRLKENLEFVLCLDSLGKSTHMNLHVSKLSKADRVQSLYNSMNATAKRMGIDFNFVVKKINLEDDNVYWEHEQFSKQKVFSGTLSSLSSPLAPFQRLSLFDDLRSFKLDVFKKNLRFLTESVVHHLYDHQTLKFDLVAEEANEKSLFSYLEAFDATARSAGFMSENDPLFNSLHETLKQYCTSVVVEESQVKSAPGAFPYVFYSPTEGVIAAMKVKPVTFDVLFFILIVVFLLGLHISFTGFDEFLKKVKQRFSTPKK